MALDTINALITLAELKSYLAADTSDEFITDITYDEQLNQSINAASIWANNYTGVDLLSRAHTEYYDGNGSHSMFLNNFPVQSTVAEIDLYIDSDRQYGADTKVADDDLILYAAKGKIVLDSDTFSKAPQSVKIIYTAGHGVAETPTAVPSDIKRAVLLLASALWKTQKDRLIGIQTVTTEGQSLSMAETTIPPIVNELLEQYSRLRWGSDA